MVITQPIVGCGLFLRSVVEDDASFIVTQRRAPRARRFLGETDPSSCVQKAWISQQRSRAGDLYFVAQTALAAPLGTIGLYNLDSELPEWGRFLIKLGSKAAPATLLAALTYALEHLKHKEVFSTVLGDNAHAIAFYDWVGLKAFPKLNKVVQMHGQSRQQLGHILQRSAWPAIKKRLSKAAEHHQASVAQER